MKLFKSKGIERYLELIEQFNSQNEELELCKSEVDSLQEQKGEIKELAKSYATNFKRYDSFSKAEVSQRIISMKSDYDKGLAGIKFKKEKIEKAIKKTLSEQKELLKNKEVLNGLANGVTEKEEVKEYCDNIVIRGNEILLLQRTQAEDDKNSKMWTIPGGHRDGEDWREAAIREFVEETGVTYEEICKEEEKKDFYYHRNKFKLVGEYKKEGVWIKYYKTEVDEELIFALQGEEIDDFKWVSLEKLFCENSEFELPFNMKENLRKLIYFPIQEKVEVLKADNPFEKVLEPVEEVLIKADELVEEEEKESEELEKGDYKDKIEKLNELRDPEKIEGGKADKLSIKDIAEKHKVDVSTIVDQLQLGIKEEMEHTKDEEVAKEIALDHISKSPIYYKKLEKVENEKQGSKDEVDYIDVSPSSEKCNRCSNFEGGKCAKVKGKIDSNGYCSLWNLK